MQEELKDLNKMRFHTLDHSKAFKIKVETTYNNMFD
jgi:hypothetical protein